MDPNIKQSIIDRLKQTNNVLVTVKSSPNVDQLAACIGLTLFLNKIGKHATAVFSGEVPSTIEFLKPEDTLEKDTNSLRDFIISLDKSKADKLRYKVEDKVVKIFITPYRTSLSQADLDFSQGDFNVDVVIAVGVHAREELDQAIVAHGRILHDATIVSINNTKAADLGALNWHDEKASSLSEMVAGLVDTMQPNSLDAQMSTAFLTGIVAETDRFSNPKTTSATMSLSAKLMAAGANQQLVAAKLQEPVTVQPGSGEPAKEGTGTLDIEHPKKDEKSSELPQPVDDDDSAIHIDEHGNLKVGLQDEEAKAEEPKKPSRLALDPPSMGGTLTASGQNNLDSSVNPLADSQPHSPMLSRDESQTGGTKGVDLKPNAVSASQDNEADVPQLNTQDQAPAPKLEDLLGQPSEGATPPPPAMLSSVPVQGIDEARKAVDQAAHSTLNVPPSPVQSLNAQPLGVGLNTPVEPGNAPNPADTPLPPANNPIPSTPIQQPVSLPPNLVPPASTEQSGTGLPPTAPPPVPPPMMPPNDGYLQPPQNQNGSTGFDVPM